MAHTTPTTMPAMPSALLSPPPPRTLEDKSRQSSSGSASPHASPSTSNYETSNINIKKRHNLTPSEQQALQLQKLLANPDREVKIPKAPREKALRPPKETIKNVSGSSAGAGSGEFHVYKHSRRREYERIKLMQDQAKREKEKQEYEEKQRLLQEQSSAKTNKNRAKREKKKEAKLAARGIAKKDASEMTRFASDENGTDVEQEEGEDEKGRKDGQAKRKRINAEGTAQIVFRKKNDDEESEEE